MVCFLIVLIFAFGCFTLANILSLLESFFLIQDRMNFLVLLELVQHSRKDSLFISILLWLAWLLWLAIIVVIAIVSFFDFLSFRACGDIFFLIKLVLCIYIIKATGMKCRLSVHNLSTILHHNLALISRWWLGNKGTLLLLLCLILRFTFSILNIGFCLGLCIFYYGLIWRSSFFDDIFTFLFFFLVIKFSCAIKVGFSVREASNFDHIF